MKNHGYKKKHDRSQSIGGGANLKIKIKKIKTHAEYIIETLCKS